jgi:hypothetical protein
MALQPGWQQYRAGGNQFRYNCVDWIVKVLTNAGLAGKFTNTNPQPFGDSPADLPGFVVSLIGWVWDHLP